MHKGISVYWRICSLVLGTGLATEMCADTVPPPASAIPLDPSFIKDLITSVIAPGRFVIIPGVRVNLPFFLARGENNQPILKTQASGVPRSPEQAALGPTDCFYSESEEEKEMAVPQSPARERIHLAHFNLPLLRPFSLSPPPPPQPLPLLRADAQPGRQAPSVRANPRSAPASGSLLELRTFAQKLFTPNRV